MFWNKIYVIEVAGRAVASFNCSGHEDALALTEEHFFREDLMALENDGRPLWDGSTDLTVRAARYAERRRHREHFRQQVGTGEAGFDDELVMFLVPVSDPTDNELAEAA